MTDGTLRKHQRPNEIASLTLALFLLGLALAPVSISWLQRLLATFGLGSQLPPPGPAFWLFTLVLSLVAGLGTRAAARQAHPSPQWTWAAPASLALVATYALLRAPTRLYWLLTLCAAGLLFVPFLWMASAPARRARRVVALAALYVVAWLAFTLMQQAGAATLPLLFGLATLLAAQALSLNGLSHGIWWRALVLGWCLVASGWAMQLGPTASWGAGAVQLLLLHAGLTLLAETSHRQQLVLAGMAGGMALVLLALSLG